MPIRGLLAVVVLVAAFAETSPLRAAPTPREALDTLAKLGLVKKGPLCLLAEEAKLTEAITALPALEKKCREAQLKFEEIARINKAATPQLKKALEEYEQLQKLLKTPNLPPQQQQTYSLENNKRVALIEQLQKVIVELGSDRKQPAFAAVAMELSAARHDLAVALLNIQNEVATLDEKYQPLREDADLKAAIAVFGPGTRLGPAKNYTKDPPKTATAEKLVFGDALPLYQADNKIVFDVLINDSNLLKVGYRTTSEYAIISTTALEAAGCKIPADAQLVNLQVDGSQYPCKLFKIPKLRVGKFVVEDVEVLASPPTAKFLGPWLGTKSFTKYEVHAEVDDLKFTIRSLDAPAEKKPSPVKPGPVKPGPLKPVKP